MDNAHIILLIVMIVEVCVIGYFWRNLLDSKKYEKQLEEMIKEFER